MPDYPGRHRFGSGQALLDEHDGPFMRIGGGVAGHGDKIVRCPWIDLQVAWISGGQPAHVHEEADRTSGVEGKSVSVRLDRGGRRIIKKKNVDQGKSRAVVLETM